MPGTASPQHGAPGVAAIFQDLRRRLAGLEAYQRQTVSIQPGTITRWGGSIPPAGALACNGATFSATQYPALAAVLGGTTLPTIAGTPIYVIWT